jgi:hypothetical protein
MKYVIIRRTASGRRLQIDRINRIHGIYAALQRLLGCGAVTRNDSTGSGKVSGSYF